MLSPLRNRFGIPGVISVIALVFAMLGGAYAASNDDGSGQKASASAKAKKGPRGPRGPKGAPGATGPAGPKGDKGDAGSNGTNGGPGADGKSVTGAPIAAGGACGVGVTGVKYSLSGTDTNVCNGKNGTNGTAGPEGSPWTAGGTLPSKKTETGVWAGTFTGEGFVPISFPIPLAAEILEANTKIIPEGGTPPEQCENTEPEHAGTASVANPEADPGFLCVYTNLFGGGGSVAAIFKPSGLTETGAGKVGATLQLTSAGADAGYGTFAVTAP